MEDISRIKIFQIQNDADVKTGDLRSCIEEIVNSVCAENNICSRLAYGVGIHDGMELYKELQIIDEVGGKEDYFIVCRKVYLVIEVVVNVLNKKRKSIYLKFKCYNQIKKKKFYKRDTI